MKRKDYDLLLQKINFILIESFNESNFIKTISQRPYKTPLQQANIKVIQTKSTLNALENKLYFTSKISFSKCAARN